MDTMLTRFPAGSRPVDYRLGRVASTPITLEHLCAAVEAIPGARIRIFGGNDPEEIQLGVETFDPVSDTWRVLVSVTDGEAHVEWDDLEDRQSSPCHVVAELARRLDACLVTEDGVVLAWGGEWQPDA